MKKFFKILGIALGSLLGFVLVIACVAVYVVFTPKQLTPVVDKVAGEFLTCNYEIGNVDLTFFSTFPEFGLRADGLLIVNPTEGAQSDTLLEAKKVVARIDLMAFLKERQIEVHEVALDEVTLNPFIGADGHTNFDIVSLSTDTVEEDTTGGFSLESISLNDLRISLNTKQVWLEDERDSLSAKLHDASILLTAKEAEKLVKGKLDVKLPALSASFKGVDYATDAAIALRAPYALKLEEIGARDGGSTHVEVSLSDASLELNNLRVEVDGQVTLRSDIETDLKVRTNTWHLSEVLALVPEAIFTMPADITADGDLALEATVKGIYNDSTMPLVDAVLHVTDATGAMKSLPYTLTDVRADIVAHVDLNQQELTQATIQRLEAKTKQSSLKATGEISDLMGNMLIDLAADVDVNIPDAAYFFPESVSAKGRMRGPLKAKITLDDLTNMRLTKGRLSGDLAITDLDATMDDMTAQAKQAQLSFAIPNRKKATNKSEALRLKNLGFLDGCLQMSNLHFVQEGSMAADLGKTDIDLQLSDILSSDPVIYADLDISGEHLNGKMVMTDSLGKQDEAVLAVEKPSICAYVEYDTKDTLRIPTLKCSFAMSKIEAEMDTIKAHICTPKGEASISGGRRDKTQPRISAKLQADDVDAEMGKTIQVETGKLIVSAAAQHSSNKENILLEWQPRLNFHLQKAKADLAALEPTVKIPEIKFEYSNQEFRIDTSRIELGHSDFSLSGDIKNIGPYLEHTGLLKGVLNFYSSKADINELLSYVSGFGNDEEETEVQTETESAANPFIVPKGVDFTVNTHIQEADVFEQHLTNLGGRAYVKDGVLIIEEMGFICEAAKLQLTAMYKSPRRNHLFVGFDYHMTDIHIEELVNMIPQVDSMLPMLRSFKGAANFHLAAETYLNSRYEIKPSTTRGACSIDAKDLTLLDGETFTKIAKILTFNKKTENKIDSISAEIALYKQQLDIYPFLITCDKWMGAVGGQHNLDMSFDYHVNLLQPLYIGVGVKGTFDDLSIKPEKCIYAKDFRPVFRREIDTQSADIRKMIKKELEKNMK